MCVTCAYVKAKEIPVYPSECQWQGGAGLLGLMESSNIIFSL